MMTAGAKASALAGEREQIFGIAVGALYTSKSKVRVAAVKVFIDYIV